MSQTRSWMAVPALAVGVLLLAGAPAFAADTATIYDVTQEGLTSADGQKLADAYGIPNSVAANGAFTYTGKAFGAGPAEDGRRGQGRGRPPDRLAGARHPPRCESLRPLSDAVGAAPRRRAARRSPASAATSRPSRPSAHTELTTANNDGKTTGKYALDTSVSYNLTLGGLPATGQGAKLRITFAGDGSVTQLSSAIRQLDAGKQAIIISSDEAAEGAAPRSTRRTSARPRRRSATGLSAELGRASSRSSPTYTCNPVGGEGTQANRLRPGRPGRRAEATFKASLRDGGVDAARPTSPAAPRPTATSGRRRRRCSSTTPARSVAYKRAPRDGKLTGEGLTLEVTDANGLTATATGVFEGDGELRGAPTRAAAASASSRSARPTSASSRPSTSGSARRTPRSASRT